jgi:SAM-dependent methyltransferase
MTTPADPWTDPEAYERYMGRWSRRLARAFVEWLRPSPGAHWLEIGCGTGALTAAIAELAAPASVAACDPSERFVEHARRAATGPVTVDVAASPDAYPARPGGFDAAVSSLVLNFIPDRTRALAALHERVRTGGLLAATLWDYEGGIDFLRVFWEEALVLDSRASTHDESIRFRFWRPPTMASLFGAAGLTDVKTDALTIPTEFAGFDDFWQPFLGGAGPAPGYVAGLDPARREALRARLEKRLKPGSDGLLRLQARAWAVRGTVVRRT